MTTLMRPTLGAWLNVGQGDRSSSFLPDPHGAAAQHDRARGQPVSTTSIGPLGGPEVIAAGQGTTPTHRAGVVSSSGPFEPSLHGEGSLHAGLTMARHVAVIGVGPSG